MNAPPLHIERRLERRSADNTDAAHSLLVQFEGGLVILENDLPAIQDAINSN